MLTFLRSVPSSYTYRSRFFRNMATASLAPKDQIPAPVHRGMRELDRSKFVLDLERVGVSIPGRQVTSINKAREIRSHVMAIPKRRSVEPDPENPENRLILLKYGDTSDIPSTLSAYLSTLEPNPQLKPYHFTLEYDHWNAAEILQAILPEELLDDAPTSFTQTGHIAHMNLRDEFLPYKKIIGQVMLDKNVGLRTVVNKLDSIDTEFRVFKMEVLAGEDDFIAHMKESDCKFTFDFSKVYWNSRLGHEHDRLVQFFSPGTVIADVMAGVGPFAVPAVKNKRCFVLANDLNPESTKWMEKNRLDNGVQEGLRITTLDGREFIQKAALELWRNPFARLPSLKPSARKLEKEARRKREADKEQETKEANAGIFETVVQMANMLLGKAQKEPSTPETSAETQAPTPRTISHFVMNLPGSALEFLDAYNGCYAPLLAEADFPGKDAIDMPIVHVHCFTKEPEGDNARDDICKRASGYLGHAITHESAGFHLHYVRKVAPNKDMYCVSFELPREVAFR